MSELFPPIRPSLVPCTRAISLAPPRRPSPLLARPTVCRHPRPAPSIPPKVDASQEQRRQVLFDFAAQSLRLLLPLPLRPPPEIDAAIAAINNDLHKSLSIDIGVERWRWRRWGGEGGGGGRGGGVAGGGGGGGGEGERLGSRRAAKGGRQCGRVEGMQYGKGTTAGARGLVN